MKKVVLITGSSSGIGASVAELLSKDYEVILHYNKGKDRVNNLKEKIAKETNSIPLVVQCDLSKEEEIDKMLDEVYQKYPRIDILINNAGIAIDTTFEDKTKENYKKILDINLIAPFLLSQKIGPKMKENKYGVIINISSTNALDTPYIESIDYDSSKAGLISISNNLANYLSSQGILCLLLHMVIDSLLSYLIWILVPLSMSHNLCFLCMVYLRHW